jgi:hypothetical protein
VAPLDEPRDRMPPDDSGRAHDKYAHEMFLRSRMSSSR